MKLSETIFQRTYAFHSKETWEMCADRVATFVANGDTELFKEFYEAISTKKFMPGGRYLYSAGREIPQTTNCFLCGGDLDSRIAWGELLNVSVQALTTGGGVGIDYSTIRGKGTPIKRYGGVASGPLSLMFMVNEVARHVLAGGKRRSALYAGLNWAHPDIEDFIVAKNWPTSIRALKEKDFNFPANLDMTNISVGLDDSFFKRIKKEDEVKDFYYRVCKSMCKTGEPGFSVNIGKNSKQVLRNPCLPYNAPVLTPGGIVKIGDLCTEAPYTSKVWTGKRWAFVLKKFNNGVQSVYRYKTTMGTFVGTQEHRILENGEKIQVKDAKSIDVSLGDNTGEPRGDLEKEHLDDNLREIDIIDGLVLGDGSIHKASNNLVYLTIGTNDQDYFSSEISKFLLKERSGLSPGAWEVATTITSGELSKTYDRKIPDRFFYGSPKIVRGFLRGLFSANGYCLSSKKSRVGLKQTSEILIRQVQMMLSSLGIYSYIPTNKTKNVEFSNGIYECKQSYDLNISGDCDKFAKLIGFIQGYKNMNVLTVQPIHRRKIISNIYEIEYVGDEEVFDIEVDDPDHTYWTGGCLVSNCGEITSDEDGDCCNLGSVNLSRITSLDELERITKIATKFLYLGTFKGWLPHPKFKEVRERNRRIGVGLMGLHEWCLKNDQVYEPSGLLGEWLSVWKKASNEEAKNIAKKMKSVEPVALRSVAPNGTTSIIAETTGGIEPIFCVAYRRRFLGSDKVWQFQYVIDPTTAKLAKEKGIDPNDIEDSVSLAKDVERRISMQAFVQEFVDQAISSTINIPEWGEPGNNNAKEFSRILLKYLSKLRGITVYPEGAREGQPITPIRYETAIKHGNVVFDENPDRCVGGVCGI